MMLACQDIPEPELRALGGILSVRELRLRIGTKLQNPLIDPAQTIANVLLPDARDFPDGLFLLDELEAVLSPVPQANVLPCLFLASYIVYCPVQKG